MTPWPHPWFVVFGALIVGMGLMGLVVFVAAWVKDGQGR